MNLGTCVEYWLEKYIDGTTKYFQLSGSTCIEVTDPAIINNLGICEEYEYGEDCILSGTTI